MNSGAIVASFVEAIGLFHPDWPAVEALDAAGTGVSVVDTRPSGADAAGRLDQLVHDLAHRLTPEGVGYLVTRPADRPQLRQLAQRHGLIVAEERLHVPIWHASVALVPLAAGSLRYALANLIPKTSRRAQWAAWVGRQPGGVRLLARLLPVSGLVVRRPGARPLFDWALRLGPPVDAASTMLVRTGWRPAGAVTILYALPARGTRPSAVIKVGTATSQFAGEVERLAALTPPARHSGATTPDAATIKVRAGRQVLLQTAVAGQLAATLVISKPARVVTVLDRLSAWLEQWNTATLRRQALTPDLLSAALARPAARLAPYVAEWPPYEAWLRERWKALQDRLVPVVAAHNDLTMWNVLLDEQGRLGVVDWESSAPTGLPLQDLVYAIADGVAATHGYQQRLADFQACYAPGGAYAAHAARWQRGLCQALTLPADLAQLCWHLTWLHHAANEQARAAVEERPFLQIVQWVVVQPQLRAHAGLEPPA